MLIQNIKQRAFSLIEVLITLALISMIFLTFSGKIFVDSSRQELDRFAQRLDGTISFCMDEAVLTRKIIRLTFLMDKSPMEYFVEVANDNNFLRTKTSDNNNSGQTNAEKIKKNKNYFSKVSEFEDLNQTLPENIQLIGLGTLYSRSLTVDGISHIYFYPDGTRDQSLIIVASEDEVMSIDVPSFLKRFKRSYINFKDGSNSDTNEYDDATELKINKAKEIFKTWLK